MNYSFLFGLIFFFIPKFVLAQESKDALYYFLSGREAYEKKDFDSYFNSIKTAYQLRPDHPSIIKHMAQAYAIKDSLNQSIYLLSKIWEMGLQADIENDQDFDSLKKDPRYRSILKRLALNKLPLLYSDTAVVISEKDLITEGIAYYEKENCFYIGSVRKGKILKFKNNQFVSYLPNLEEVGSILGMKVDQKKNILWICSSFIPQYEKYKDSLEGKTAIVKYDLIQGKILNKYTLNKDRKPHSFGDVAVNPRGGELFVADSESRKVYKLNPLNTDTLKEVNIFSQENLPFSLQGITFSDDGKFLFIADYLKGIFRIDLKNGTTTLLKHPLSITTVGVDGLCYFKGSLIAIQNGVEPNRVVRLYLNKSLSSISKQQYLEANHPAFDEPTSGVIVGDYFYYIASSQWSKMNQKGEWIDENSLKNPVILRVLLNNKRP